MKRLIVAAFAFLLALPAARAEVKTEDVTYEHGGKKLVGHLAWDDAQKGKRPGVLVVHEFWGLNDYARKRAEKLAALGYVAFACDMYGEKATEHPDDARKMMEAVKKDVKTWVGRAEAGLDVLRKNEHVDATKLAAIGYCFGGSTVLELAFRGAEGVKAVASFHGGLQVPESTKDVKARILICHGADDKFIPDETIKKLKETLDAGKVSYKFIAYPGAVHSFTVPEADKHGMKGVAYNAEADKKSWEELQALLKEVFGEKK